MTQLRLWGQPKSINVQKVLWALDELALPYERIDAGGTFGRNKDADYLSLNPNGLIPALEVDGAALWESNAIVRFLFNKYGSAPLHPSDPIVRARADQWMEWYGSTYWPNTRVLLVQLVRTPEAQRDKKLIESTRAQLLDAARILEAQLERQPFVGGDHFTWGDIPLGAAAHRFLNLPFDRPALPATQAWYARLRERGPYKKWIDLPLS